MTVKVTKRETCRACDGALEDLIDFGEQYIINFGDKPSEKAPLVLTKCDSCHLVQLRHTVDPEYLFRTYYYKSGVNQTMRDHLKGIVEDVTKRVTLKEGDVVVDIGSNDGTLLSFYQPNLLKLGFEPSNVPLLDGYFEGKMDYEFYNNFFSYKNYDIESEFTDGQHAKVITAISMFYDLDDPNTFLQDIKKVLAPDGLFVIQMNYLPAMLENNAVDNIVHEHLTYYSLYTLDALLVKNGLEIVDYSFNDLNGGSFRVYVKHSSNPQHADFPEEGKLMLHTLAPYKAFRDRVAEIIYRLQTFIPIEKINGRTTYIYGASTRGATLLQYAGLDEKAIPYAVERNPDKVGTMYLGKIPVISEKQARMNPPYYYLALPWAFRGEFLDREWTHITNSGAMIFPLPQFRVVRGTES